MDLASLAGQPKAAVSASCVSVPRDLPVSRLRDTCVNQVIQYVEKALAFRPS